MIRHLVGRLSVAMGLALCIATVAATAAPLTHNVTGSGKVVEEGVTFWTTVAAHQEGGQFGDVQLLAMDAAAMCGITFAESSLRRMLLASMKGGGARRRAPDGKNIVLIEPEVADAFRMCAAREAL